MAGWNYRRNRIPSHALAKPASILIAFVLPNRAGNVRQRPPRFMRWYRSRLVVDHRQVKTALELMDGARAGIRCRVRRCNIRHDAAYLMRVACGSHPAYSEREAEQARLFVQAVRRLQLCRYETKEERAERLAKRKGELLGNSE